MPHDSSISHKESLEEHIEWALSKARGLKPSYPPGSQLAEQAQYVSFLFFLESSLPLFIKEGVLTQRTGRSYFFGLCGHEHLPSPSLDERDSLIRHLKHRLSPTYHDFFFCKRGGTSFLFFAHRSDTGDQEYLVKIDGSPKNKRARRHLNRGYNVDHEARILQSLPEARAHHLPHLVDFFPGQPGSSDPYALSSILVQHYFPSVTLYEAGFFVGFQQQGLEHIFRQVLDAATYLENQGFRHRDITPFNILLESRLYEEGNLQWSGWDGKGEAMLIDLNMATPSSSCLRDLSTCGSLFVRDPTLDRRTQFDGSSEVYALGKTLLFALTGSSLFPPNPDFSDALVATLYDHKDPQLKTPASRRAAYHAELSQDLSEIHDQHYRRYIPLVRRALSLNRKKRFSSVREFADAFFALTNSV